MCKMQLALNCDFCLSNLSSSNALSEASLLKWTSWLNLIDTKPKVGLMCAPRVPGGRLNAARRGICQSNGSWQEENEL